MDIKERRKRFVKHMTQEMVEADIKKQLREDAEKRLQAETDADQHVR